MSWFRGMGTPPGIDGGAPAGPWRVRPAGMAGRSRSATQAIIDHIKAGPGGWTILQVTWADLQPTPGALDTAKADALAADFAWAASNGLPVGLRFLSGFWAPDHVKTAAGTMSTWYGLEGGDPAYPAPSNSKWLKFPGPMPKWWTNPYALAYRDVMERLAAYPGIGDAPNLSFVTDTLGCTYYGEINHQFFLQENRIAAKAAGFTTAKDLAAMTAGIQIHKAVWSPLGVGTSLALLPHQSITTATPPAIDVSEARAIAIGQELIDTLGPLALLAQNSVMYGDGQYPEIMAWIDAKAHGGQPANGQTQTTAKHLDAWTAADKVTPLRSFQRCVDMGMASVEVPAGGLSRQVKGGVEAWPAQTLEQSADVNARLRANLALYTAGG